MRIISKCCHAAVGVFLILTPSDTLAFQPSFRPALSNPHDVWSGSKTTTTHRLSSPSAPAVGERRTIRKAWTLAARSSVTTADEDTSTTETNSSTPDATRQEEESEQIARTKQELLDLSRETARGFRATNAQRRRARQLIFEQLAPSFDAGAVEPARAYYKNKNAAMNGGDDDKEKLSLQGKWELVYTDAPDITSLDQNSLATLGRIGQESEAPFIKNVIEWKPPSWAANLPFSGVIDGDNNRVLQKVVTKGTADPARPAAVDLQVAGLQIETATNDEEEDVNTTTTSLTEAVRRKGLVAGLLQQRPVNLVNPDNALPFGTFEVVYLDETLRVTRTGQDFIAVNRRLRDGEDEVWF